jgi:hypothetical protein
MGHRTGLDDLKRTKFLILSGLELRPLGRPARSQSLYRMRYPGSYIIYERYLWYLIDLEGLSRSRKPKLTAVGIRCADHATPSIR